MKSQYTKPSTTTLAWPRSFARFLALSAIVALSAATARAQTVYTPVFSNVWVVTAGTYPDLPQDAANNSRGAAINPVNTNVLFISTAANTNGGSGHVATLDFASGSNYLAQLNGTGVSGGTYVINGVRVADDGAVYACNRCDSSGSTFKIYRWASDTDVVTEPQTVALVSGPSFTWRIGDHMDVRGSGINTEIVVVGAGAVNGATVTTNFVIFRPTDAACTNFTNFSITLPGATTAVNLCGSGVAFEGTNNVIWVRQLGATQTRRVAYDPSTLTATCARTNTTDFSGCGGLKYFSSTNGVEMLATLQYSSTLGAPQVARVFRIPTSPTGALVSVLSSNLPPPYTTSRNTVNSGNVDVKNGHLIFGAPGYGLSFFKLDFVTTSPPVTTLSIAPASTIITGYPVTMTASATGSTPLSYQWYFNTNTAITDATNTSYSLPSVQTGDAGVYSVVVTNLYGRTTNYLTLTVLPDGSSPMAAQLWSLAPGSRDYLTTGDTQRGLAYDPVLQSLVLVSRSPTNGIHLLDAATGADQGELDMSAFPIPAPGTYAMNMCGVAEDGVVYVGNLLTSTLSDSFAIYSWTGATNTATMSTAYTANPAIARLGDTMAVRGSGLNTEILCSFRSGTNVALFNTADGVNFNFNLIAVTNAPAGTASAGFAGLGIAFGPGNTFWVKSSTFNLRQVSYDLINGVGEVINSYDLPGTETAIGVDNANGYVAALGASESPQNLAIYDLAAVGGPSLNSLVDREFFPVNNANSGGTGSVAVDVTGGRIFALDSNNGIIALNYAGRLAIAPSSSGPVVTWPTAASALQSSTSVTGTYTDVVGATSPHTNNTGGTVFYRLRH